MPQVPALMQFAVAHQAERWYDLRQQGSGRKQIAEGPDNAAGIEERSDAGLRVVPTKLPTFVPRVMSRWPCRR